MKLIVHVCRVSPSVNLTVQFHAHPVLAFGVMVKLPPFKDIVAFVHVHVLIVIVSQLPDSTTLNTLDHVKLLITVAHVIKPSSYGELILNVSSVHIPVFTALQVPLH